MHVKRSWLKCIRYSSLLLILFCFSEPVISQDTVKVLDRVYGLDQTLYNGKKYDYFLPYGTKGNQFLLSPDYIAGTVTLKGKCYRDITLNYDILNQLLLLKYVNDFGTLNIIEVSTAWLSGFSIGNMNFEVLRTEKSTNFYQVLGEGRARVFYFWRKNLNLDATVGSSNYTFTSAVRDSYVYMDGKLRSFRSRRGLIGLFDPKYKQEIKTYLHKNKINVNKASDQAMAEMITFIGNLK